MKSLSDRLKAANSILAAYAVPHHGQLGRVSEEPSDDTRFSFQRDRDRIIHTQAFRRLKGKTQVFVAGEGDHYRTRLTHTMEVAQIGRDIARTLGLNEDLTEAIALAHDLGHPPFGHAGEDALNRWMREHASRFEHNEQSLRIVMLLEEHSSLYRGLNLNREILEGLQKHRPSLNELRPTGRSAHDLPAIVRLRRTTAGSPTPTQSLASNVSPPESPRGLSLEAQIVNIADEIAYTSHDAEDGLRAGLFSLEEITRTALGKKALEKSRPRGTSLRGALIHLLVTDLYEISGEMLRRKNIRTLADVYAAETPLIAFSPARQKDLDTLRDFLWKHMYLHPSVLGASERGKKILWDLCEGFFARPTEKILELQKQTASTLPEAVKDYVAGMTDDFATESYKNQKST
ncbi:dNTP triphosphohydrolase [Candidatus Peregrinibacteria bacterium]|nr:dNTP triphosphohydrolase [Candidatus Peregrinibacteria bacterium]